MNILESTGEDFSALKRRRNNACTTLVPKQVIEVITEYYTAIAPNRHRIE